MQGNADVVHAGSVGRVAQVLSGQRLMDGLDTSQIGEGLVRPEACKATKKKALQIMKLENVEPEKTSDVRVLNAENA